MVFSHGTLVYNLSHITLWAIKNVPLYFGL